MSDETEINWWAQGLYKDMEKKDNWNEIKDTFQGLLYRTLAKAALARHNVVCDRRCPKCTEVLTHWCAHCDRT